MKLYSALTVLLVSSATASLVDPVSHAGQDCSAVKRTITQLKKHVAHSEFFCAYYLGTDRAHAPLPGQTAADTSRACQCILDQHDLSLPAANSGGGSKIPKGSSVRCNVQHRKALQKEFTYTAQLCRFMKTLRVSKSPAAGLTLLNVMEGCKCLLPDASSKSTTGSTTRHSKPHKTRKASSTTPFMPETTDLTATATDSDLASATDTADETTTPGYPSATTSTTSTTSLEPSSTCAPANKTVICPDPDTRKNDPVYFSQYYSGSGYRQSEQCPVTVEWSQYPPVYINLNGTATSCPNDIIEQCGYLSEWAPNGSGNGDLTVYYFKSNSSWLCVQYYGQQRNEAVYNMTSCFNETNPDIEFGYGYTYNWTLSVE
ncbi:hypothetical protein ANO11243_071190 [Dothideomycetidae sp. 11243]|nr:hypothetical protein ANO11243_071190 [fungal sp. No.11243]